MDQSRRLSDIYELKCETCAFCDEEHQQSLDRSLRWWLLSIATGLKFLRERQRERECVCVCVCVWEREREREISYMLFFFLAKSLLRIHSSCGQVQISVGYFRTFATSWFQTLKSSCYLQQISGAFDVKKGQRRRRWKAYILNPHYNDNICSQRRCH